MIPLEVVDTISQKISQSVERVLTDLREGLIETEPNITDRLLANIQRDFEDFQSPNQSTISISTRTLRDRGRNAAETHYGADLATLLDVDIPGLKVKKGFLAQAKYEADPVVISSTVYPGVKTGNEIHSQILPDTVYLDKKGLIQIKMGRSEFERLREQCNRMLKISSGSFVFVYSQNDVYVIPAEQIVASKGGSLTQYDFKNLKTFMEDYLKCFTGDRNINGLRNEDFDDLADRYDTRTLLYLQLRN